MKCPRTVNDGKDRCGWEGDDVAAHAAETGHQVCIVCRWLLRDDETRTCNRCISRALGDLADIEHAYAELPSVIECGAFHGGRLPGGDALVMLADGSVQGGGPDDHIDYHDPVPVLAELHQWERDWREEFGHNHFPRWQATVVTTTGYLRTWMWLAARTHPAFDDYVHEIRRLRTRLLRTAGLANDPKPVPALCFDCGGSLVRPYTTDGLADDAECSSCGRSYSPANYGYALLALAASCQGWVTIRTAADAARRPERTVWTWMRRGVITAACRIVDRRIVVEWEDVQRAAHPGEEDAA